MFALSVFVTPASAVTLNLTDSAITLNDSTIVEQNMVSGFHAGVIDGILFRRVSDSLDSTNSGSGNFRNLYSVQASGSATSQQGYNREVMDTSTPGGFNEVVTIGDLHTDSSGTFYVFAIDVNEPGNHNSFISLDDFQLYVGGSTDVDPLPSSDADLATLGTKVYDMDEEEESVVMLDGNISSGSGHMDLYVFVPISQFDGLAQDSMVYLYTQFGVYTDASDNINFESTSGAENISTLTADNVEIGIGVPSSSIPEPSSSALVGMAALMLMMRCGRAA